MECSVEFVRRKVFGLQRQFAIMEEVEVRLTAELTSIKYPNSIISELTA
jgi:hypothetical protein